MPDERTLEVSVVTPEGAAYEGRAAAVVAPAFDGEVAFLPAHAPFVGVLGHGELRVTRPGGRRVEHFYLAGGVARVADDVVTILAETVVPAAKVDADEARRRLEEALATPARGNAEIEARLLRMDDARARLRTAERQRLRGAPGAGEVLQRPVE